MKIRKIFYYSLLTIISIITIVHLGFWINYSFIQKAQNNLLIPSGTYEALDNACYKLVISNSYTEHTGDTNLEYEYKDQAIYQQINLYYNDKEIVIYNLKLVRKNKFMYDFYDDFHNSFSFSTLYNQIELSVLLLDKTHINFNLGASL